MYVILAVAAALLVMLLIYGYLSNYMLKTEYYDIATGEGKGRTVKIVMLADLHGNRFGADNARLINKIREETPDLICMAGDMTVKDGKGTDSCLALCKELVSLCPVFYAPGNHEIRMENYDKYVSDVMEIGVNWLDNEHKYIQVKDKNIWIYGLNMEEHYYHKFWQYRDVSEAIIREYLGTAAGDGIQLLLAHNPEYFEAYCEWGGDLIFSGHVHGGIARLPLLGGVIAPSLRLFPRYDSGLFRKGKTSMVLSRGLGTHHIRLRFFNSPEISVINLS